MSHVWNHRSSQGGGVLSQIKLFAYIAGIAGGRLVAAGVQTVWLGVLDHLDQTGGHLPALTRVLIGGSPCPDALIRRMEQRLGVVVQTSWGITERPMLIFETRQRRTVGPETLQQTLRGVVPDWWLPEKIVRVERMPLAATGKIDKFRLRAEYAHDPESQN